MNDTPENKPATEETTKDEVSLKTENTSTELTPEEAEILQASQSNLRKKRLIIAIIILLVILIGGGVGAYFFLGKKSSEKSEEKNKTEKAANAVPQQSTYVDLEDFIVNLDTTNSQVSFLKLSVSLEIDDIKNDPIIKSNLPKIRDSFQVYLRQMRPEDLKGSEGLFLLREELLLRINKVLYPITVKDILFNEIIVQ